VRRPTRHRNQLAIEMAAGSAAVRDSMTGVRRVKFTHWCASGKAHRLCTYGRYLFAQLSDRRTGKPVTQRRSDVQEAVDS